MSVAPERTIAAARRFPSITTSDGRSTTFAPVVSGSHSSRPRISKEMVVTDSIVSPACIPGSFRMAFRKLTTAAVRDLDAFGFARGTGSIEHIGQVALLPDGRRPFSSPASPPRSSTQTTRPVQGGISFRSRA